MNTTEWAEAERRQAEHDALTPQLDDGKAEREQDLIAVCDDCALDSRPVPEQARMTLYAHGVKVHPHQAAFLLPAAYGEDGRALRI
ncbi:hypothetical protein ACFWNK_12415 [Streptomyces sp. NPDC058417]|uniref:hypothetical protein n=1 Tax=unclassified Streptomyces TaxID=2593676 RepID=UPI0036640040